MAAKRHNGRIEIRGQDHGPGIAADKLDKIFDRFYRGDDTNTKPGFGLGLPISKALTEGKGWIITIESEPGSKSTTILQFSAENGIGSGSA